MSAQIIATIKPHDLETKGCYSTPIIRVSVKYNRVRFSKSARHLLKIIDGGDVLFHIMKCNFGAKCLGIEVLSTGSKKNGFHISAACGETKIKGLAEMLLENLGIEATPDTSIRLKILPDKKQVYEDLRVFMAIPVK